MISAAIVAKKLAIVITITSRLITCVSSWAMTPSSSAGSSMFRRPRVAQTVADFCERPSAKALGIARSITPTRGLGRSAWMQSRSMIAVQSGSCGGRDLVGAERRERDLVGGEQLDAEQPDAAITMIVTAPALAAISAPTRAT